MGAGLPRPVAGADLRCHRHRLTEPFTLFPGAAQPVPSAPDATGYLTREGSTPPCAPTASGPRRPSSRGAHREGGGLSSPRLVSPRPQPHLTAARPPRTRCCRRLAPSAAWDPPCGLTRNQGPAAKAPPPHGAITPGTPLQTSRERGARAPRHRPGGNGRSRCTAAPSPRPASGRTRLGSLQKDPPGPDAKPPPPGPPEGPGLPETPRGPSGTLTPSLSPKLGEQAARHPTAALRAGALGRPPLRWTTKASASCPVCVSPTRPALPIKRQVAGG